MSARKTADFPEWYQHVLADTEDQAALKKYVDALPERERIAYIYANKGYMHGDTPAYQLHTARVIAKRDGALASDRYLAGLDRAALVASLDASAAMAAPEAHDRIFAAIGGLLTYGALTILAAGAALVLAGPHLAGGMLAIGAVVTLASGALRALTVTK